VDVPRKPVERLEGAAQVVEIRPEEELPGAGARSGKPCPAIDQLNTPQLGEWKETAKSPLFVVAPVAVRGGVNSTRVENSPGGREKIGKAEGAEPKAVFSLRATVPAAPLALSSPAARACGGLRQTAVTGGKRRGGGLGAGRPPLRPEAVKRMDSASASGPKA